MLAYQFVEFRDGSLDVFDEGARTEEAAAQILDQQHFERRRHEWLPSEKDREYIQNLMHPVHEVGKIASWVAPPRVGINRNPFAWEYVRL